MQNYNRFQGDPAVQITLNGAVMQFSGGQPIMDQGIENAALISAFTRTGWWGNTLFTDPNQKIGSDYQSQCEQPITALSSLNRIANALNRAFKWITDTKLAKSVNVTVTNPNSSNISASITIEPPAGNSTQLLFLKNGINWINQATNAAHTNFTGALKQ